MGVSLKNIWTFKCRDGYSYYRFILGIWGSNMNSDKLKSLYKCPVCDYNLFKGEGRYFCDKGHSFDISRGNYVNLLVDNQKKSKEPGDNKEMIESRRNFLNKEYYSTFSDELNKIVFEYIDQDNLNILDSGCGEGYFLAKLKNSFSSEEHCGISFHGIDISKAAIKYASKRDKNINFAVGSSFNLPFMNGVLDFIIRNFAPGDNNEFHRVLKERGKLVIVTPGIEHLYELKEVLYNKARKHETKDLPIDRFKLIDHREIKYNIELNQNEDIKNLVSMTPYYWSIDYDVRNNLDKIEKLKTTIHVNFDIYERA